MEWVTAVLAAIGGGLLSTLVTPSAQRRAEEVRIRQENRRARIRAGRELIHEALAGEWDKAEVIRDARYFDLNPLLSDKTKNDLSSPTVMVNVSLTGPARRPGGHLAGIRDDLNRLERKWKLI